MRRLFFRSAIGMALLATLLSSQPSPQRALRSKLCVFDVTAGSVNTIYTDDKIFEAPNWSPDGKDLLFNSGGNLYRISAGGGQPRQIELGGLAKCNNDKGFSPNGRLIAFSSSAKAHGSQVYTVEADGGVPKMIVPETPSYFHAFSPDGRYLAFVAQRNGNFDLFRVPVEGGAQEQLTSDPGYDDGPDYSPDGKWIYFNSNRSGKWAVWRIPADGAGPKDVNAQQVTFDDVEDWFPHCSPDGKHMVFVTFPKGTATHNDRMPGVELRIAPLPGDKIEHVQSKLLLTFYGGQGTINVDSWSPDSTKFAFVSFEPITP
jgi:TolB protein